MSDESPQPRPVTVERLILALAWQTVEDNGMSLDEADRLAWLVLRAWRDVEAGVERRSERPRLSLVVEPERE